MCGGTETVFYSLIKASDKTKYQYGNYSITHNTNIFFKNKGAE